MKIYNQEYLIVYIDIELIIFWVLLPKLWLFDCVISLCKLEGNAFVVMYGKLSMKVGFQIDYILD